MPGKLTIAALRRQAVLGSLPPPTTLARAIGTAGFVQADPIRAPARAQDLILRHRVAGYRAGDLERRFARLGLEEDFLYAYGFMPRDTVRLLHPRDPETSRWYQVPRELAAEVLAFVRDQGPTHPADLEQRFGRERAVNGWGGFSKATTRALQNLHYHGLLRVAGRRDGIRIYEAALPHPEPLPPEERCRRIVLLVVGILAPLAEAGLAATFGLLGRGAPGLGGWRQTVEALLASGELESGEVDGERYYWPAAVVAARRLSPRRGAAAGAVRSASCGSGGGSSICGAGNTGSRPTQGRSSAASAITRCRCCGATRSSAGPMSASRAAGWMSISALSARVRAIRRSAARSTRNWRRWRVSWPERGEAVMPKLGYLLPTREQIMEGRADDRRRCWTLPTRAEALGYDSVWVGDSLLARPRHEPLTLLAGVAGRVPRVALGTAVLLPALRNPVLLAHQVATLDQVSEGRFILGVGIARDVPNIRAEFAAAGVPFEKRVGRMMEGLRLCRALWSGEPVDWDGRWPVQRRRAGADAVSRRWPADLGRRQFAGEPGARRQEVRRLVPQRARCGGVRAAVGRGAGRSPGRPGAIRRGCRRRCT